MAKNTKNTKKVEAITVNIKLQDSKTVAMQDAPDTGSGINNMDEWGKNLIVHINNGDTLKEYPRTYIWKNKRAFLLDKSGKPAVKQNGEVINPIDKNKSKVAYRNYLGSLPSLKAVTTPTMYDKSGNFMVTKLYTNNPVMTRLRSLDGSISKYINALSKASGSTDGITFIGDTTSYNDCFDYTTGKKVFKGGKLVPVDGATAIAEKPKTIKGELTKLQNACTALETLTKTKAGKAELKTYEDKLKSIVGSLAILSNSLNS